MKDADQDDPRSMHDREVEALWKAWVRSQVGAMREGPEVDSLENGVGPFGRCETNPVPTGGLVGSRTYLAQLRAPDGAPVQSSRLGSTFAEQVTAHPIDVYQIECRGENLGLIFLCPYHPANSRLAPEGLTLGDVTHEE